MKKTRKIRIGNIFIGGGEPIRVQSMTNTPTEDVGSTVAQINRLEDAGCEIVRVAVPTIEAAQKIKEIKRKITIPLVADIHFDYKLALEAVRNGVDKIRINPGNIGGARKVKKVVEACKEYHIPIRVGANSGSINRKILDRYGGPTAEALFESVRGEIEILENEEFTDIVVSVKSTDLDTLIKANELVSSHYDYPLHIGLTEAGPIPEGIVKSTLGIGLLLKEGIGDTIRVSLTADPVYEVYTAYSILQALNIRMERPEIISCPTCGRIEIDMDKLIKEVRAVLQNVKKPIKVAVLGCSVNGPGEAREADIGIAGGTHTGIIFRKGKIVRNVKEEDLINTFKEELDKLLKEDLNAHES